MARTGEEHTEIRRPRSAQTLIFLIVFLDLLGVGLIAPLSPYIMGRFDTSGMAVAMLTLCYSAAQFLATPVLGVLSDRFGRRPVLVLSLLGSSIGYVVFATAGTIHLLFLSRLLDGATGGNISTAQAYIADITPAKDRAKAYGLVGAAFGLGFTLGPAFGALLTPISLMAPVWAAAGLSLVTMSLVFFFLPETVTPEKRRREPITVRDLNPLATLFRVLLMRGLPSLILVIFMLNFAHAELRTSFGILLKDKLSYSETSTSWMFAYLGMMAVLVQGGLVRKVAPRLGNKRTALLGLPLAAAGYALLPVGHAGWVVVIALGLMALGDGLSKPTITSMLSGSVDPRHQGAVMGASQATSALALVLGPILAGQLYDHVGRGWPFWTGAMMVAGALLVVALRRRSPGPIVLDDQAIA